MQKDPVCGMEVDPAKAAGSSEYHGTTYYFCSVSCLERFKADPARFTLAAPAPPKEPAAPVGDGVVYTCPMHPEVRQGRPGACPKCGMALEPDAPVAPAVRTEYTCPMHPEIVRDAPGACPICGMALEPRTVSVEDEENPELVDMRRRFVWGAILGAPVFVLAMADMVLGAGLGDGSTCASPTGSACCWPRRSCGGPGGRSSSEGGRRSSTAAPTCSR